MKLKWVRHLGMVGAVALGIGGCRSAAVADRQGLLRPLEQVDFDRARQLKDILEVCLERGCFIDRETFEFYGGMPDELMVRASRLGLTRLHLRLDMARLGSGSYFAELAAMAAAAHRHDLKINLLLRESAFDYRRSGNWAWREWFDSPEQQTARQLERLLAWLPDGRSGERLPLDGLTLELSAHESGRPGALFNWYPNGYGIGRDNDELMKASFRFAERLHDLSGGALPMTVVVPYDYHLQAASGNLSCGSINDFWKFADQVIVLAFANTSTQVEAQTAAVLAAADKPEAVLIGLQVARHPVGDRDSVRRRTFGQFLNVLAGVTDEAKMRQSFGGVNFSDFYSLENIWEW